VRRFVSVALSALCAPVALTQAPQLRGFPADSARAELAIEAKLAAMLSRDSTGAYFRVLTAKPHPAGSARNEELARYVADHFRAFGFDTVIIHKYDVYLPWPESVSVTMTSPVRYDATLKEDAYPQDSDTQQDAGPTYLGMSASGDVSGELVYANSGNPADYDWLESQGVSVKGKIALVRYSNPYSYRGFKALTAQQRGLKAVIIYSDPQEDGYRRGLTFPNGPWGPASHLQRGSITYDFLAAGDPLTPGWASVEGAHRIPAESAISIPHVIMMPISARDAQPLLEQLTGPVAPASWQGALPITYRVGAGPAVVRVHVKMDDKTRSIYVVEARLRGSERPDELVVLGNHRDAWVFGAVDPSSGTATELELARALGALAKQGMRPKRTIVINSWDAEEWHLTGSTEWGEEHADELRRSAVAYINVDGSVSGPHFNAEAQKSLDLLIGESVRDVKDPNSDGSVLDAWKKDARAEGPHVSGKLGSGSDYTVFLNFIGLPIVDMTFGGPYGVYHSTYDNYYWMTRFGDPGFKYMTVMSEVWGRMALRLANAPVLPLTYAMYAERVRVFVDELAAVPGVKEHLDLAPLRAACERWSKAALALEPGITRAESRGVSGAAPVNAALVKVEQSWLLPDGLPGRPWFKHALYAPKYTYAAMEFPGVREAVDKGDWTLARAQLALLVQRVDAVTAATKAVPVERP
jgi:N-acetylated-alpha-linked acidic dipeptidase